ncbi:Adenine phosphoribosyltransferase [Hondaea fermentalgiana]|uniref:adenine phosphoribosyltransferase n=1 Tax=Hondaea fermentalgiana TaxID=2315210 RepID=A0A2R5GC57_9STRA|nr:Adenine phosphoribosyltransferase [Hondaea fermentalgiana]|eukprot:GBG28560.1 Adenine phosphoribosyltransferase [Hondaea fermentalgiana]
MTQDQFAAMLRDLRVSLPAVQPSRPVTAPLDPQAQFEAGMLFEQYDADKSGRISKEAFQRIFHDHLARNGMTEHLAENYGAPSLPRARTVRFADGTSYASDSKPVSRPPSASSMPSSPLPQLSALPAEYGDSATALLRRDFLHLQTLLEATLAPRIEAEVHMLEQIHLAKREIRQRASKIEAATRAEAESMIERLNEKAETRCGELERVANKHRKVLEKVSQFQYLAAGPRPRDALRMDPFASSHYSSAMSIGLAGPAELDSSEDPSLASFRRQRERAQASFRDQERFPHPVVMRDFVNLFQEFQNAAQKIIDAPYADVAGVATHRAEGAASDDTSAERDSLEHVRRILDDKASLPNEMADKKLMAEETAKLRDQLRLKDQMIFTLVQEREGFEQQKLEFLKELSEARLQEARQRVAAVTPYFAFKGIERFYDIGGFLKHPEVFEEVITLFADHLRDLEFDSICGLDARGFILGPPVALRLNKPFFMVRKEGKLPNSITGEKYGKEYESGQDRLCVPVDAVKPGQRVVVIDDLVATGGTALAALELVKRLGGVCTELACVIEIKALGARRLLEEKGFGDTNILSIVEEDLLTLAGEPAANK